MALEIDYLFDIATYVRFAGMGGAPTEAINLHKSFLFLVLI